MTPSRLILFKIAMQMSCRGGGDLLLGLMFKESGASSHVVTFFTVVYSFHTVCLMSLALVPGSTPESNQFVYDYICEQ